MKSTPRLAQGSVRERAVRWRGAAVFGGKFVVTMAGLWLVQMSSPYAWALAELTRFNAVVCGAVLRSSGVLVEVLDGTVSSPTFALTVIPGCSGLEIWFFVVAAMVAFPSGVWAKLLGMGGALVAIISINVLRIVSLFLVGQFRPQDFDAVHLGLWPAVLNFGALAILGAWLAWTRVPTGKPV